MHETKTSPSSTVSAQDILSRLRLGQDSAQVSAIYCNCSALDVYSWSLWGKEPSFASRVLRWSTNHWYVADNGTISLMVRNVLASSSAHQALPSSVPSLKLMLRWTPYVVDGSKQLHDNEASPLQQNSTSLFEELKDSTYVHWWRELSIHVRT